MLQEFYLDLALELRSLRHEEGEQTAEVRERIEHLEKVFYGKSAAEGDRDWMDEMIAKLEAQLGGDEEWQSKKK